MNALPPLLSSDATCRQIGPEAFQLGKGESAAPAKRICRACPDYEPCRMWAVFGMPGETDGVVGGTTKRERERLRREARLAAA